MSVYNAETYKQISLCYLYVCIGYLQEVSSTVQQLLSCVARSSQSSHEVAQQAIVGLTRMAGQHTLVPQDATLKPILRLLLRHTSSVTCVCVCCPGSMKESLLTIACHLCHNLHEQHGIRLVCAIVLRCHCLIHISFNRWTTSSSCTKTTRQLCAVAACAVQLQAQRHQQCLHVCSCRSH